MTTKHDTNPRKPGEWSAVAKGRENAAKQQRKVVRLLSVDAAVQRGTPSPRASRSASGKKSGRRGK